MRPEVIATMLEASTAFVNIDELNAAAGETIARMLGAEAALVTAGAAAGLVFLVDRAARHGATDVPLEPDDHEPRGES